MASYFVTATGTDIGKTYFSSLLVQGRAKHQHDIKAIKPVLSGFDPNDIESSDSAVLLRAMQKTMSLQNVKTISPWLFSAPLSPNMAAAQENQIITLDDVVAFCHDKASESDHCLVEGVGGVMVPLNEQHTILDWMKQLDWPVILVTGTYLGTISHTLTAASTLLQSGLKIALIVFNESIENPVSPKETMATVRNFLPDIPFTVIYRGQKTLGADVNLF